MIEKICRSMCIADANDPDRVFGDHKGWMTYEYLAIAALNAMKDPTDPMKLAGHSCPVSHSWSNQGEFIADGCETDIWQDMINAALSEHKNSETV